MTATPLLLGLVGDLLVDRDDPGAPFDDVRELLAAPDILFGNIEGPYTDNCQMAPSAPVAVHGPAHCVQAFGPAGFDVVSLANNHIVDAGHAALLETREALRRQGIATCGAGQDIAAARQPAIVERGGQKVAFLAYSSVFPMGFEARPGVPGLAPMRAYDFWRPSNANYHAPGMLPLESTVPDESDLAALKADISAARAQADIVVTSFHWGDFLRAYHLTDHEKRTARFCVEHGADMVVGHHHHMLRGMEWVDGKPVLYGLGHFVFDVRWKLPQDVMAKMLEAASLLPPESYSIAPRAGWPLMPMHPDARMTVMAWVSMEGARATGMGFVPCRLRPDGRVQPVSPDSEEGREVVAFMAKCQTTQGLNGRIEVGGPVIGGCASLAVVPLAKP